MVLIYECLVGEMRKGKLVSPRSFFRESTKNKSPKFGEIYREKIGMGKSKGKMTHLPLTMHMVRWFSSFLFLFGKITLYPLVVCLKNTLPT